MVFIAPIVYLTDFKNENKAKCFKRRKVLSEEVKDLFSEVNRKGKTQCGL